MFDAQKQLVASTKYSNHLLSLFFSSVCLLITLFPYPYLHSMMVQISPHTNNHLKLHLAGFSIQLTLFKNHIRVYIYYMFIHILWATILNRIIKHSFNLSHS